MNEKSCFLAVSLLIGYLGLFAEPYAYVSSYTWPTPPYTVCVIDTALNEVVDTITSPEFTIIRFLQLTPDRRVLYLATNLSVVAVDTQTKQVTPISNTTAYPFANIVSVAITPDGKKMYVVEDVGNIKVVNCATNVVEKVIVDPVLAAADLEYMVIAPDGKKGYLPSGGTVPGVFVVDVATDTLQLPEITNPALDSPEAIAITPDGKTVYVGNNATLSRIDTASNTVVGDPIPGVPNVLYLAISPDGKTVYAARNDGVSAGLITVVPTATNVVTNTVSFGAGSVALVIGITPDGKHLYMPEELTGGQNKVGTLTLADNMVGAVDGTFTTPSALAMPWAILPPTNLAAQKVGAVCMAQIDVINFLTWEVPLGTTPVGYRVYRDSALTQLAGSTTTPSFADHDRTPGQSYTYYVVSVDQFGNQSAPASITVS
jgi:DNA-binding beta-propeller fold protein YncE